MSQDDIIEMAREAGFTNPERLEIFGIKDENLRGILEDFWINLERFAALVAAHEREACANLLLNVDLSSMDADHRLQSWTATVLLNFSAAIRARGEQ